MDSVGAYLSSLRKSKGVSLEEIQKRTKISLPLLQALEADHFDSFRGETYLKGFIRSYAKALEVDPNAALEKYSASIKRVAVFQETIKTRMEEEAKPNPNLLRLIRQALKWDKVKIWVKWFLLGMVALLAAYFVYIYFVPAPAVSKFPYAKNFVEFKKALGIKDDNVYLIGMAIDDVWLSVRSDLMQEKSYEMKKGDTNIWKARKKFYLKIGNAGGLRLQLNEKPVGVLGKAGQVISSLMIDSNGDLHFNNAQGLTVTSKSDLP